jgi:hypothetical protein
VRAALLALLVMCSCSSVRAKEQARAWARAHAAEPDDTAINCDEDGRCLVAWAGHGYVLDCDTATSCGDLNQGCVLILKDGVTP